MKSVIVIAGYHPHLHEAAIAYMLRRGTWKSKGRVITGKALTAPEQWRYLSHCDLVLIINETVWNVLEPKGRELILDHELSHFTPPATDKNGNLRWTIREHDLQEFSAVVRRHGVCTGDHRRLIEAAGQLDLESLGALTAQEAVNIGGDFDDTDEDDNCFEEEDVPFDNRYRANEPCPHNHRAPCGGKHQRALQLPCLRPSRYAARLARP